MKRDDNVAAFAALDAEDGAQYRRDVEEIEREAGFLFALLGGDLVELGHGKTSAEAGLGAWPSRPCLILWRCHDADAGLA